jgi:hypothetical protein
VSLWAVSDLIVACPRYVERTSAWLEAWDRLPLGQFMFSGASTGCSQPTTPACAGVGKCGAVALPTPLFTSNANGPVRGSNYVRVLKLCASEGYVSNGAVSLIVHEASLAACQRFGAIPELAHFFFWRSLREAQP